GARRRTSPTDGSRRLNWRAMRWLAVFTSCALVVLTACQPAATPQPTAVPPTVAPTVPPKPTAAPPTAAPTTAPTAVPQGAGKLTIDVEADLDALDPYLSYTPTGLSIHHNIHDYLLERDINGDLAPGLAESWKAINDTTLEFTLRRGVK